MDDRIPSLGARRRLQALAAAGHTWRELSGRAGLSDTLLREIASRQQTVLITTHDAIRDLYDTAAGEPIRMPDLRIHHRRWPLPIQWVGINIDDPAAQPRRIDTRPDHVLVDRVLSGHTAYHTLTYPADRLEVVRQLAAAGHTTPDAIAYRLRCGPSAAAHLLAAVA